MRASTSASSPLSKCLQGCVSPAVLLGSKYWGLTLASGISAKLGLCWDSVCSPSRSTLICSLPRSNRRSSEPVDECGLASVQSDLQTDFEQVVLDVETIRAIPSNS